MIESPLLLPMLVQMILMVCLTFWLIWARPVSVARGTVKERDVMENGWQGWIKNAGDNYNNQFEMPLFFFIVCLTFLVTGTADKAVTILAWMFVGFRIPHALIQLTTNNITHRFLMFFLSTLGLIGMIIRLALKVL